MSIIFLREDALRTIQSQLIQTYGGLAGVRSQHGLGSAAARPKQLHHYTGEARIGALAASLTWALLRNHPFNDGNKRIALAALVVTAHLNGYTLMCSEAEETAMILRVASTDLYEDDFTAWALSVVVLRT